MKRKPKVSRFSPVHLICREMEADFRRNGSEPPEGLLDLVIFASCPRMLEAPNILEAVLKCCKERPGLLYKVMFFVWDWFGRENNQVQRGNKLATAKRFLRDNLGVVQRGNDLIPLDDNWVPREGDRLVRCDTQKDAALAEMLKLGRAGEETIRNARRALQAKPKRKR